MNKWQLETLKAQLGSEEAVLKALEKQYRQALKDIDDRIKLLQADGLTQSRIYHIEYQKTLRKQVQAIIDKLHADTYTTLEQFLNDTYKAGYAGTMYDVAGQVGAPVITPIDQAAMVRAVVTDSKISGTLYDSIGVDAKALKKTIASEISRGIATGLTYEDIARNISAASLAPLARAKTIARTEGHRIYEASAEDARQAAVAAGADVVKVWDATLDGSTRSSHQRLDGQVREADEPFEYGGKKAMRPGEFGDPGEDCNCRCHALTRSRSRMDANRLKIMQERAEFFGLDKTKDFDEFQRKYLQAAQTVEKLGKSGIIVPGDNGVLDLETGVRYYLAKGTRMQDVEVFAGKGSRTEFRQAAKYAARYGGSAADWQHAKGKGVLSTDDGDVKAEIHWVQCEGVGKKEMFVKEWLE